MTDNNSFIQEVSEEVRRDKLFRLFRRYSWAALVLILLIVAGASFNEFRKSSQKITAQEYGEELRQVLNSLESLKSEDLDLSFSKENFGGRALAAMSPDFLTSNIGKENKKLLLQEVAQNNDLPIAIRDLALLYSFYISGEGAKNKAEILNELSGPDRPFNLIAMEAKVDLLIGQKQFDEALSEIEMIENAADEQSPMWKRIYRLKEVIRHYKTIE